jgi:hypothetical protein
MFNFFTKKIKITPKWSFSKQGYIWRIMFGSSGSQGLIVGEHRRKTEKVASFFCLDEATGRTVWNDVTLHVSSEETWLVGLEGIYKNTFLLHGYYDPSLPEHLGLYAYDVETHEPLWKNDGIAFVCITAGKLYAYKDVLSAGYAERSFLELDIRDGRILRDMGKANDEINLIRDASLAEMIPAGTQFATHFDDGQPEYSMMHDVIETFTDAPRVTGGLDLIRHDELMILGCHEQTDKIVTPVGGVPVKGLDYKLKVIDIEHANVVFQDTIAAGMGGFLVDGFFTKDKTLYYVKERSTLTAIQLP